MESQERKVRKIQLLKYDNQCIEMPWMVIIHRWEAGTELQERLAGRVQKM